MRRRAGDVRFGCAQLARCFRGQRTPLRHRSVNFAALLSRLALGDLHALVAAVRQAATAWIL
jgi:stress-induced morphogen